MRGRGTNTYEYSCAYVPRPRVRPPRCYAPAMRLKPGGADAVAACSYSTRELQLRTASNPTVSIRVDSVNSR